MADTRFGQFPLPTPDDDRRFTLGLVFEVAAVLRNHGYPEITHGRDINRLRDTLRGFIYDGEVNRGGA